jgi:membrane associated rhomboid family serine protease
VLPIRDDNPTRRPAVLTVLTIVACAAVFVFVQQPHTPAEEQAFLYERAAIPCEVASGEPVTFVNVAFTGSATTGSECSVQFADPSVGPVAEQPFPRKQVYLAVLVSMFLHGSWAHLLGNVLFLWIFGNNVEDRLGPLGFVVFYLLGGVAAAAVHIVADTTDPTPVIGASGAIAAVMGAYLVWYPHARVTAIVLPLWFFPFVVPAAVVLAVWFVMQFFTSPDTGVAWLAHVGGFVFGALAALPFRRWPPDGPLSSRASRAGDRRAWRGRR